MRNPFRNGFEGRKHHCLHSGRGDALKANGLELETPHRLK